MAFWNKEKPKAQTIAEPDPTPVEATPTVLETVPVVAAPSIPAPMPQEIPPAKPKKKPKSAPKRKRPFDAHIWFSEAEQRKLERRVEASGLSKGVFIRKAALENPIVIDPENSARSVAREERPWMIHDEGGQVLRCEICAGGKHQDNPTFRHHCQDWLLAYTRSHGLAQEDNNRVEEQRKQQRKESRYNVLKHQILFPHLGILFSQFLHIPLPDCFQMA